VFSWRDVEAGGLLVVNGYAIDSNVDPVGIRILLDDEAPGPM